MPHGRPAEILSAPVLIVADLFHPVDDFSIELLLNGNVGHGGSRGRTMPMFLSRGEPDHVAGTNLLDGSAFALNPSAASHDNESLTERMGMPCGPRAGFEGYAGTLDERRIGCLKKRIDPHNASEPV